MLKKILLVAMVAVGLAFSSHAKTTTNPNYTSTLEKKATALSVSTSLKSTAVTLSSATEDGKKYKYLHYYKMTLKKGNAYTVWLSGQDAVDGKVKIRTCYGMTTWDWNTKAPVARFEAVDCGVETRWLVTGKKWSDKDEWEDFDWSGMESGGEIDWGHVTTPSSWTYYIVVEGDVPNVSAKVNYIAKKKIPTGVVSNPLVITPKNSIQTTTLTDGFMSDYYYVKVACKAGYCYRFGAVGGSEANVLSFIEDDFINGTLGEFAVWTNAFNGAVSFYSSKKQTLTFRLLSSKGYTATGKIRYYVEKQKAIGKHTVKASLKVGKSVEAVPGYLNATNAPAKGYFDMIADEQLFKISLKKDKHYVIETVGADAGTPIIAYLYDSSGKILQKNASKGSDSPDVRLAYTPTKSTTYYIGVCENHGLFEEFVPKYIPVTLSAVEVATITKTVKVLPVPAVASDLPKDKDVAGSPVITFGTNCWYATAKFGATKDVTYAFSVEFDDPESVEANELTVEIYKTKVSSSSKYKMKTLTVEPGQVVKYVANASAMHYLRIYPKAGKGLDYKPFRIHATGYYGDGKASGAIKVTLTGASGQWAQVSYKSGEKSTDLAKRKKAAVRYESGTSVIVPVGTKRVFFTDVKGYTTPKEVKGAVVAGETWDVADGELYYTDKWDPKDDKASGTSLSISSSWKKLTTHTLWKTDQKDYFYFTAKQGYYYSFKIDGGAGDQVFTIRSVDPDKDPVVEDVKSVSRVLLPKTTNTKYKKTPAKYYLIVSHGDEAGDAVGGKYTLSSRYENLGVVKFSKSTYTVSDTSTTVTLSVSRTASKGEVRVRYATVDGSAKDGTQYFAKDGYLSWKDGDKSTKKITVKLIPKTLPLKGKDLSFKVKLTDASQADDADDGLKKPLVAVFSGTKTSLSSTVKIANKAKYTKVSKAYASAYKDKKTTLKKQEKDPLRSGTFYGLVRALEESAPTNGAPEFGVVTLTVTPGKKPELDKLSAKAQVAGATYTFAASTGWDGTNEVGLLVKTLRAVSSADPAVTNELTVTVTDGKTADWKTNSTCKAELSLYIPDVEGGQRVAYAGELRRRNAKIQAYLDAAFKFDGYYTLSLIPEVKSLGAGYLTVTVDAKGGAKVAGVLPDKSAISVSATACAVVPSSASANGWVMIIPVFKSSAEGCFAGELYLVAQADSDRVDGKSFKIVFYGHPLFWNSDSGVNQDGSRGWRRVLCPCGGWYDKLVNLQGYYNSFAQSFWAESKGEFPAELLSEGYQVIEGVTPFAIVNLAGNAFSAEKRNLVRNDEGAIDFEESVNPCNVTVKINRATGVTTGTGSVWTTNGELQEEVTGFSHFGVLTLDREDACGLAADTLIYGALVKPVAVEGGASWMFSMPFLINVDED